MEIKQGSLHVLPLEKALTEISYISAADTLASTPKRARYSASVSLSHD